MLQAKIIMVIVVIAAAIGGMFASRKTHDICVLYTPNAQGLCVLTWPQPVTLLSGGNFRGYVPVTDIKGRPCQFQNVFDCIEKNKIVGLNIKSFLEK
jgi:hypothetical protein